MQLSLLGRPGSARSAVTTTTTFTTSTSTAIVVVVAAATLALAGCAGGSSGPTSGRTTSGTAASTTAASLALSDAWVKAADNGMTSLFGTIKNSGPTPVTVVSATSDAAAMVELHEVVTVDGTMKMQPKQGGFTVPAGGSHALAPGGDHVMLMGLKQRLAAGDPVTVVLTLSDGSAVTVSAVVKDFSGANETYAPTPTGAGSTSGGMQP